MKSRITFVSITGAVQEGKVSIQMKTTVSDYQKNTADA